MKLTQRLQRGLSIRLTRDWRFTPAGSRTGGAARQLLVIAPRPVPTVDYYLGDLLHAQAGIEHRIAYDADVSDWVGDSAPKSIQAGTRVILVRMPSSAWADIIEAAADKISEVVWLIDDDIVAARDDDWLPREYRSRLLAEYLRFRARFGGLIDRVWASTPPIAARFPAGRVELRPPRASVNVAEARRPLTIFYHGTASHRREQAFLLPILEQVQARSRDTVVEIAGDHALYRMFRGVPRLRVVHPMPWPDYLSHLHAGKYDIGLVPLLDTPFNRARSGIKALELAAIGARGLLSRREPYLEHAGLRGMQLVGDAPSDWIEGILRLVEELQR